MRKIAVIDDDVYIGNMLEEALTKEGFEVVRAYSGTEALLLLNQFTPDIILLDLMLPGLSGEKLLPMVKGIPVIVVSAKAEVQDKVDLLLAGACDYITKPFEIRELLARIAVQLRRDDAPELQTTINVGDLSLDMVSHEVTVGATAVHLTKTEYAILKLLMQHPKKVFSKAAILDRISMDTPDCTDSSLKQHISNVRRKLRESGDKEYIEAVWGIGFKLADL